MIIIKKCFVFDKVSTMSKHGHRHQKNLFLALDTHVCPNWSKSEKCLGSTFKSGNKRRTLNAIANSKF